MARLKIDYGIDLGTTNSAICRMEKGVPTIKKIEVQDDIMPSCFGISKRKSIRYGKDAYNALKEDKCRATKSWKLEDSNIFIEFKRTMGTDQTYHSSILNREYTSEELSAEILKALKSYITDETFRCVVITIPAKFTVSQNAATAEAAKLAGFEHCVLLQEPIAAAMAYGLSADDKTGIWMVFDFGGGTFDAALLKAEDGIMQVFDTEGDNYLGGKNLDYAIVDQIIIPYLRENYTIDEILADITQKEILRDALKVFAEKAKNDLSFKETTVIETEYVDQLGKDDEGENIDLDIEVTQAEVFDVMRPLFQKAVDICKKLIERNHIGGSQLSKIIMIGGPTHSPLIRQMLREQITPNVDTSIDPMTAVAMGAALYASTLDAKVCEEDVKQCVVSLKVGYEATSVETSEWVSVQLDPSAKGNPTSVFVELVRSDKAWSSGRVEIDMNGNVIEANLVEGKPNSFSIMAYDAQGNALECFPNEITIIQGTKVGAAPLPYHFGIGLWNETKKRIVFEPVKGLEKNMPFPATGTSNGHSTTSQLRPGIASDILRIPIYQADDGYIVGATAALYEYVTDVIITGEDVSAPLPADSDVDLTIKAESSERIILEAFFPSIGEAVEKQLSIKKQSLEDAVAFIPKELRNAQRSIDSLASEGVDVFDIQQQLKNVMTEYQNSSEKKAVLQHLKEVLRAIETLDNQTEWDRVEKELRDEFGRLEAAHNDLGNDQTRQLISQLRPVVDQVIRTKDVKMARELIGQISGVVVQLAMVPICIGHIRRWHQNFSSIRWANPSRARTLIDQGLNVIAGTQDREQLRQIVSQLIDLLPKDEQEDGPLAGSGIKKAGSGI